MSDILTTEEAAELMRMSIPTIRGLAATGEVPAIQMGEWRFLKTQLLDYMAARAKDEQRRRQEQHAERKNQPEVTELPRERGRPRKHSNKVDLSQYQ
jgi:excisionase family DNA binding protein